VRERDIARRAGSSWPAPAALRADQRYQEEGRAEGAEQGADGRQCVEAACDRTGRGDSADSEPDGEGGDHPEQHDRRGEQQKHRDERPHDGARGRLVEPLDGQIEERLGHERRGRHEQGGDSDHRTQDTRTGTTVGEAPTQPVTERERGEDDADQVRPDDRRRPEVRCEHPGGRDLGRERGGAGDEDDEAQRVAPERMCQVNHLGMSGSSSLTRIEPLEAEQALDLAQDRQDDEDTRRDEGEHYQPEPESRPLPLATMLDARSAPRSCPAVSHPHRVRVDRRGFLRCEISHRLGHGESVSP
jgi:hypothetical protein